MFVNNIKKRRYSSGLTQKEMSKKTSISLNIYREIENNKRQPNSKQILLIRNVLNLKREQLFESKI